MAGATGGRFNAVMTKRWVITTAATAVALAGTVLAGGAGASAAARQGGHGDGGTGPGHAESRVRLIGERDLGKNTTVGGTRVGELSGISYDPRTGRYYLIADDSTVNRARFYTARINLGRRAVHRVRFTGVHPLRRPDGSPFPMATDEGRQAVDPESIRVDPRDGTLYWGSEGERAVPTDGGTPYLVDPFVRQMTRTGRHLRGVRLPHNLRMSARSTGPRANLVFEGLALSTDGRRVAASTEGALYQDGPIATTEHGSLNRITWWNKRTGRPVRQLAYRLDAIPAAPDPPDASADNGISELLAVDRNRYLVVERSFSSGVGNSIRVYEIDTRGAENVLHRRSLRTGHVRPVRKRLLVDLGELGLRHVDNIEGVTWGPRLPNGERSLVFVADDNFNDSQTGQIIALAVR